MAENEQDNANLWRKIRRRDDDLAHLVSARIVGLQSHTGPLSLFRAPGQSQPEKAGIRAEATPNALIG